MYTTIEYGLRKKGKDELVTYDIPYDRACYLNSGHKPWLVEDFETACYAKWVSTEWYNSNYERPVNPLDTANLEIVKVVTTAVVKESELEDEVELVNEILKKEHSPLLDEDLVLNVIIAEDIRRQEEEGEGNELDDGEEGEDEYEEDEEAQEND